MFIAYSPTAGPLFKATGLDGILDKGCIPPSAPDAVQKFIDACRQLPFWEREVKVDQT